MARGPQLDVPEALRRFSVGDPGDELRLRLAGLASSTSYLFVVLGPCLVAAGGVGLAALGELDAAGLAALAFVCAAGPFFFVAGALAVWGREELTFGAGELVLVRRLWGLALRSSLPRDAACTADVELRGTFGSWVSVRLDRGGRTRQLRLGDGRRLDEPTREALCRLVEQYVRAPAGEG